MENNFNFTTKPVFMSYIDFLGINEDELNMKASETGADRELDYDFYCFAESEYIQYLTNTA